FCLAAASGLVYNLPTPSAMPWPVSLPAPVRFSLAGRASVPRWDGARCRRHSLTTSARDVATALSQAIARRIGEPRYHLWFHQKTKFNWADDLLTVGVPNHFYQEWLENTFADVVRSAAGDVLGAPMRVRFTIDAELFQAARRQQQAVSVETEDPAEPSPRP